MTITFDHAETLSPHFKTFWFKPERPVDYVAGQFVELSVPHDDADVRGIKRWFTLSSSPTEPYLGITTRLSENGSSYKQHLATLKPGTKLTMIDPMGDFVLPKLPDIPIIFAAAGAGITPMRSMTTWLRDTHQQRPITLLHAISRPDDLIFHNLFQTYYGNRYHPLVKRKSGSLSADRILPYVADRAHTSIYISGPEVMIERLYTELQAAGVDKRAIVTDYFHGYPAI